MRRFVVFLGLVSLAAAVPAPGDQNLHEMMTKDEVMQVFRVEPHAVPKYQVVPIHFPKEHKRAPGSGTKLHINAFGRNIKLWLNPTEGVLAGDDTPVYFASSIYYSRKPKIIRAPGSVMADVGQLLEDREKQATMISKTLDNGKSLISGIVGSERLVVRPLPNRVNEHYSSRFRRSEDNTEENHAMIRDEAHYHVVYALPEKDPKSRYMTMPLTEEIVEKQLNRSRRAVIVPDTIYPQVLVFADYATYRIHGYNTGALLEYLLPFWNGVDLKYRSLVSPKVRFNIAGIVIGQDANALSYVSLKNATAMWIDLSLHRSPDFLVDIESVIPKSTYDLAILMGPYTMCHSTQNDCGLLGLAYTGAACSDYRSAVIMDMGGFDGILSAAHEIGHLFAARHDGETVAIACHANDGYIMTSTRMRTENTSEWSACSVKSFDTFFRYLNISDPSCLFDKPQTSHPLTRLLPGRLMTLDEQCQAISGTDYCYQFRPNEDDFCLHLPCSVKGHPYNCTADVAPAEGTICGDKKICLHGVCMNESLIV